MRVHAAPQAPTRQHPKEPELPGASLRVGAVDEQAEVDADLFADELLADLEARPTCLRRSVHTADDPLGGSRVSPDLHARIRSARGGRAVPHDIRRSVEQQSGRDLSGVRLHTGPDADALSTDLQAQAFTVGSDVFFSQGAYAPHSVGGRHVLAHELGHVVQHGGGTVDRIRRSANLRPLQQTDAPTVRRLLGKKKSAAKKATEAAETSSGQNVLTVADLERHVSMLEKAMVKLAKHHQRGNKEDQSAAWLIKQAAQRIIDNLPDQSAKSSKVLGREYPEAVKRLRRVIDEAQLIWDEHLVEMTNKKATNIYAEAGRRAQEPEEPGKVSGFKKLTRAGKGAFQDHSTPKDPTNLTNAERVEQAGRSLGLSKGEISAIATFTVQDYKYINPAAANSRAWMKGANEDLIDKPNLDKSETKQLRQSFKETKIGRARERTAKRKEELDTLTEEGSLHAGVAMQGLLKMPVWKGTTYRGETMTKEKFETMFRKNPNGKFAVLKNPDPRPNISSTSKDRSIAIGFVTMIAQCPPGGYRVLWSYELNNGRDIEPLSLNSGEKEVATLPGAEFGILSAELLPGMGTDIIHVKCRQKK